MEPIKQVTAQDGEVLKIFQDDTCGNPREWDNLSKMYFFGNKRHAGDKHNIHFPGFSSRDSFITNGAILLGRELRKMRLDVAILKPVHWYEHGGSSISLNYTYPYNCRWDSGTCGFVVVTKQDIRKNWNIKRITQKYLDLANDCVKGEIKTLDNYIRGEVYGYTIEDSNGNEVDSCWGFYGDDFENNGMKDYVDEKFDLSNLEYV